MQATETVRVTVNGETREIAARRSVEQLLHDLGLHPRMVVVEHNREILERESYGAAQVNEGDNLELVHFVGGG